jgi:hypothetical protein
MLILSAFSAPSTTRGSQRRLLRSHWRRLVAALILTLILLALLSMVPGHVLSR